MLTSVERESLFWDKVIIDGDCWLWTAGRRDSGKRYGVFWDGRRMVAAHRYAYELDIGPIPKGVELHHICETKLCVNPAHLELRTRREHMAQHRTSHCRNGHLFMDENTHFTPQGWRVCVRCQRERNLRKRKKVAA